MENLDQKKALILILILLIASLAVGFLFYSYNVKKLGQKQVIENEENYITDGQPIEEESQDKADSDINENEEIVPGEEVIEEEMIEEDQEIIKNIIGEITMIDFAFIKVFTSDGKNITLDISQQEGVSFFKQIQDGEVFKNQKIGLFDIPLRENVEIQYNRETNKLRMVVVKQQF